MSKAPHRQALDLLVARRGRWSRVGLSDGRTCMVYDVAWGYDPGEDVAHITTNVSPGPIADHVVDFFHADEIRSIEDPETGAVLFQRGTG